ncbi:MAG TPA: tRNA pseudouridine(38-40) synthase TruA [Thermoanaerobaculia bacterium]|nr:tRNA pseudouridine(38-40) synthase TruA [Thermoanaerobaculia bacterium]
MDWRLTLAYRGGAYAGWQRQANAVAVQQVVEEALAQVLGRQVRVVGAGRTDAGVHARGQVASLALARPAAASALVHGTNAHLPDDVRVMAAAPAPAGFDARRHAAAKEYRYRIVRCEVLSPLEAPFAVRAEPGLDVAAMRAAAARLVGRHDWTAFARSGGSHTQPLRRIDAAEWLEQGEAVVFRIRGEGFLRGMVRAIVGTLLEVGRGRRSAASLAELLAGRPRAEAGASAPARGLVLERVLYPPRWLAG